MAWNRSIRGVATGRPSKADRVLLWAPSVLLATVGWAAFRDYGWVAWVALLAGAYFGLAMGDLFIQGTGED